MVSERSENVSKMVSRALQEFDAMMLDLALNASDEDKTLAEAIVHSPKDLSIEELTSTVAAVLFVEYNKHNRDFSIAKARDYAAAMVRGEWKLIHQGLAFYSDNNIADGQHRIAAVVLSNRELVAMGKPEQAQKFTVFRNFETDAMQAIDIGKRRTAGDALELGGFADGKLAASIVATVMGYEELRVKARSMVPSIYQVEAWTRDHLADVEGALKIATTCMAQTDPPLTKAETASAALALLTGGYEEDVVTDFLGAIQAGGRGKGEGSPAFVLYQLFFKAKNAANPKGKLSKQEKLALTFKGAQIFVTGEFIAAIKWKQGKEPLPAPVPPRDVMVAAE